MPLTVMPMRSDRRADGYRRENDHGPPTVTLTLPAGGGTLTAPWGAGPVNPGQAATVVFAFVDVFTAGARS